MSCDFQTYIMWLPDGSAELRIDRATLEEMGFSKKQLDGDDMTITVEVVDDPNGGKQIIVRKG